MLGVNEAQPPEDGLALADWLCVAQQLANGLAASPDGQWLAVASAGDGLWLYPMRVDSGRRASQVIAGEGIWDRSRRVAFDPDSRFVVAANDLGRVRVVPLDGGPVRELDGFNETGANLWALAVSPDGQHIAAGAGNYRADQALMRICDRETGALVQTLDAGDGWRVCRAQFTPDGEYIDEWTHILPLSLACYGKRIYASDKMSNLAILDEDTDEERAEATPDSMSGEFSAEVVLDEGPNRFVAIAYDEFRHASGRSNQVSRVSCEVIQLNRPTRYRKRIFVESTARPMAKSAATPSGGCRAMCSQSLICPTANKAHMPK